jgi:hypothetical protein
MTPTVNKSVTKDNSIGSDRNEVDRRLREIGITEPFVAITDGTKRSAVDHTDPANQYSIGAIDGTYGVMPIGCLGFVDIDTDDPPEPVTRLIDQHQTFTVKSPHGGEHHYYQIDGETSNAREQWGEIRAESWYVVGPGSVIDHAQCDDCGYSGEGRYDVIADRPIVSIDAGEFDQLADRTSEAIERPMGVDESDLYSADHHIDRRIQKAKHSKHGARFTALWEGRYRDVGYSDRSDAEAELILRLAYWFKKNRSDVRAAMNRACREHSQADVNGPRKWLAGSDSYRESTLELIENVDRTYSGSASKPGFRPAVSKLTSEYVLDALMDLGLATSAEIAAHEKVDRSKRSVQRALKSYQETDDEYGDVVSSVRDGRSIRYFAFEGAFLDAGDRKELDRLTD